MVQIILRKSMKETWVLNALSSESIRVSIVPMTLTSLFEVESIMIRDICYLYHDTLIPLVAMEKLYDQGQVSKCV